MNNKERTQTRRLFVMANKETIQDLIIRCELVEKGDYSLPIFVQQWIESIRARAGYGPGISWRTIWFTFRKDLHAIKHGWTPQHISLCDTLVYPVLHCYPCTMPKGLLSRVKIKANRPPFLVPESKQDG